MKHAFAFSTCCLGILIISASSAKAQNSIPYSRPMSVPIIENLSDARTKNPTSTHSHKIPRKSRQNNTAASYDDRTVAVEQGRKFRGAKSTRKSRKNNQGNFSADKGRRTTQHGGNTYQE